MVRDTGHCVIHGERERETAPVQTPVSAPVYNLKITINGDGNQIRDELHVKDLIRAIYKIGFKLKKQNYTLNVCSGNPGLLLNSGWNCTPKKNL